MMPRARRVTIGAGVLWAVLVTVLLVANWGILRDHLEAWHFQLTTETEMNAPLIEPYTAALSGCRMTMEERKRSYRESPSVLTGGLALRRTLLGTIVNELRSPVIIAADDPFLLSIPRTLRSACDITGFLASNGYRLIEQRFPQRAYVVIRDTR